MLAIVLLAQVAAAGAPKATPAASPTPAPTASLGSVSAPVSAKPKTLADLARERKLGAKGVAGGTLSVSGASGTPATAADDPKGAGPAAESPAWERVRVARENVNAARRALDDAASKKGMTSEDAALARKRLIEARRELDEASAATANAPR